MGTNTNPALKGSPKLGSYLRKLRAGYGYSLRRVEERARAEGGEIDNSQLSRYEKGICYPSFDKLRVLASVFNVSIQAFSDVVDLEDFNEFRPSDEEPDALVATAREQLKRGDFGQAFAHLESALELLSHEIPSAEVQRRIAEIRINQAVVLHRLGKLALAEQELRQAMRSAELLAPDVRSRAMLTLAAIHSHQGDYFLSEMEAERALRLAGEAEAVELSAMSLHMLGRVFVALNRSSEAIERFREAAKIYDEVGNAVEAARVRINIGDAYVELGKKREALRLLQTTIQEARTCGSRRVEAQAWSTLGTAYFRCDDLRRALNCFRESDAKASLNNERYSDLLFLNAFYQWRIATAEDNPTRSKIAFGRLKALRSSLESRFAEVEAFDEYVEKGKHHA